MLLNKANRVMCNESKINYLSFHHVTIHCTFHLHFNNLHLCDLNMHVYQLAHIDKLLYIKVQNTFILASDSLLKQSEVSSALIVNPSLIAIKTFVLA